MAICLEVFPRRNRPSWGRATFNSLMKTLQSLTAIELFEAFDVEIWDGLPGKEFGGKRIVRRINNPELLRETDLIEFDDFKRTWKTKSIIVKGMLNLISPHNEEISIPAEIQVVYEWRKYDGDIAIYPHDYIYDWEEYIEIEENQEKIVKFFKDLGERKIIKSGYAGYDTSCYKNPSMSIVTWHQTIDDYIIDYFMLLWNLANARLDEHARQVLEEELKISLDGEFKAIMRRKRPYSFRWIKRQVIPRASIFKEIIAKKMAVAKICANGSFITYRLKNTYEYRKLSILIAHQLLKALGAIDDEEALERKMTSRLNDIRHEHLPEGLDFFFRE